MERIGNNSTLPKFQQVINGLGRYSHFSMFVESNELHLKGNLDTGYGKEDSFNIEIIVSEEFPKKIPRVYELDSRIPQTLDRHFMTDGSGCCLVIPHTYRKIYDGSAPFSEFIDRLVVPFFQNQIHFEITGKFVMEYSHGQFGMDEYYEEIFGVMDTLTKFRLIDCVIFRKVGGHRLCPCESGKRQRYCHGAGLIELAKYGDLGQLQQEYLSCDKILTQQHNCKLAIQNYMINTSSLDYIKSATWMHLKLYYSLNSKINISDDDLEVIFEMNQEKH